MKIALLCPTRERISSVKRLVDSILHTANDLNNINLYLGIDEDDPTKLEILKLEQEHDFVKWVPISNNYHFLGLGKIWNTMVENIQDDIFCMIGDDMVFETKDWDLDVLNEFKDSKVKLVHYNDGMRGEGNSFPHVAPLAVHSFVHRIYYDTFGYYVREEWKHGYHDTWLHDVYSMLDRRVYKHVIKINHLHISNPIANNSADSVSHNLSKAYNEVSDPQKLYDSLLHIRRQEADTLKGLINA